MKKSKYEASVELELEGEKPISENMAYPTGKQGHRYLSQEAESYKEILAGHMTKKSLEANLPKGYKERKWEVHIWLGFEDNRVRDLQNYEKLIFDALTGIIWADDDYRYIPRHYTAYEPVDKNYIRIKCLLINQNDD